MFKDTKQAGSGTNSDRFKDKYRQIKSQIQIGLKTNTDRFKDQ